MPARESRPARDDAAARRPGRRVGGDGRERARRLGARPARYDFVSYERFGPASAKRVLRGARRLVAASRIPARKVKLVDASATESHLDPLTAAPAKSRFLETVIPWLK